MAKSWCKVASNLDSHPKIRRAGRNGREVFLFALRRNAEPDNPVPGRLPGVMLEPWYLADQLMMSEEDAVTGVTACCHAGLLVQDGESWVIDGWDEEWGKKPTDGATRQAKYRERQKVNHAVTHVTSRNVTRDGSDALDQIRREEIRLEEKREERDQKPDSDTVSPVGSVVSKPRPRKPKPSEPTPAELASVRVVLGKLSVRNGVAYTGSGEHVRLITAQLRSGVSEQDLRAVIGYCAVELGWADKPDMAKYLRPETLFGPKTISRYLDPARTWFASLPSSAPPPVHLEAVP
jgi:uncharacterized phage protein (TIGR02220 family)